MSEKMLSLRAITARLEYTVLKKLRKSYTSFARVNVSSAEIVWRTTRSSCSSAPSGASGCSTGGSSAAAACSLCSSSTLSSASFFPDLGNFKDLNKFFILKIKFFLLFFYIFELLAELCHFFIIRGHGGVCKLRLNLLFTRFVEAYIGLNLLYARL